MCELTKFKAEGEYFYTVAKTGSWAAQENAKPASKAVAVVQ